MLLDHIKQSSDIKKLKEDQYPELAREIRQFLIEKISKTGGHLASNLGVVELTMALEETFSLPDTPEDELTNIHTVGDLADYVSRATQE